MLMLLFQVGAERYALECQRIVEIVPKVNLKEIHHAPPHVVGLLNLRGVPIPVVDLCQLIQNRPSQTKLHTRIIVLRFPRKDQGQYLLGLMAERVTETRRMEKADFVDSGVKLKEAPYIGGVYTEGDSEIQLLLLDPLFNTLQEVLFATNGK